MKIHFPILGYNKITSYDAQIPLSTPVIINCRIRDVAENRVRGGKRPAVIKAYTTQISGVYPIIAMHAITTVFIESSS